jgi:hypothetical protein
VMAVLPTLLSIHDVVPLDNCFRLFHKWDDEYTLCHLFLLGCALMCCIAALIAESRIDFRSCRDSCTATLISVRHSDASTGSRSWHMPTYGKLCMHFHTRRPEQTCKQADARHRNRLSPRRKGRGVATMQVTDTDVRVTSGTGTGRTIPSAKSGYQEARARSLLRRRQGASSSGKAPRHRGNVRPLLPSIRKCMPWRRLTLVPESISTCSMRYSRPGTPPACHDY